MSDIADWHDRAASFEDEAARLLGTASGTVKSRAVTVEKTYDSIVLLNSKQDGFLRQALRCVSAGLNRAAQIMAWLAMVNLIFEKLSEDKLVALRRERPAWTGADIYEIAETQTEFAIVEILQLVGLATKTEKKNLHGLLSRRNECAHPTNYQPTSNEALGYIDEVINRMRTLQAKNAD
ncbi:MAG: hypothetical protein ABIQ01_09695 [Pseudolysinimonas sp.]